MQIKPRKKFLPIATAVFGKEEEKEIIDTLRSDRIILGYLQQIKFYFFLPFIKLISIFECRNYRLQMLLSEYIALIPRFLNPFRVFPAYPEEICFKTVMGDFYIRKTIVDFCIGSPAFERQDIEELIRQMELSLKKRRKVVFIDIGAGFGKYTISIGKRLEKFNRYFKIFSFEPAPNSFRLLKKNVKLNNLINVSVFNVALSDKVSKKYFYIEEFQNMYTTFNNIYSKERVLVKTNKLDNFFKFFPKDCQEAYLKIDVEGHEVYTLQGCSKIIKRLPKVVLLIEDVARNNLVNYLKVRFSFLKKITPYNSYWKKSQKGINLSV